MNSGRWQRTRKAQLMAGLLLLLATPGLAHRLPEAVSTIWFNAASGTVEIIHQMHRHDAEQAVAAELGQTGISLEQLETRAQLALYVESRFAIAPLVDGQPGPVLALQLIGAETDGDQVLVYQEFTGPLPAGLAVRNDILRDHIPQQVNRVNIRMHDGVKTLIFRDKEAWLITGPEGKPDR